VAISAYEFYRALTYERTRFPDSISASLTARIAAGGTVTRAEYERCFAVARRCRARIADAFASYDVLIAPSTPGEAPDISSTGEPTFGLMWTLLRLPCLTLPNGTGPGGLPLGIQVIAAAGCDAVLLRNAEWVRRALSA
jgi:Asp-tRNA(Asn)/Glu-tRNA(Gln) amidotransferase A subunit family amidase